MDPSIDPEPTPTYSGEVYITICMQVEDLPRETEAEVETDCLHAVNHLLEASPSLFESLSATFEDSDLYQTNRPKGYFDLVDDAYDRLKDER